VARQDREENQRFAKLARFLRLYFACYLQARHPKRKSGTNGPSDDDGPRALHVATAGEVRGRSKGFV